MPPPAKLGKNHALNRAPIQEAKKKKKSKKTKNGDKENTGEEAKGKSGTTTEADIDNLFDTKKRKIVVDDDDNEHKRNKKKNFSCKSKSNRTTHDKEDTDESDGGYEFIDSDDSDDSDDDEVYVPDPSENPASYGVIKSPLLPDIVNPEAPIERYDSVTGYPVYKAHLLKVGEGGGTPLCPFDCNCCF